MKHLKTIFFALLLMPFIATNLQAAEEQTNTNANKDQMHKNERAEKETGDYVEYNKHRDLQAPSTTVRLYEVVTVEAKPNQGTLTLTVQREADTSSDAYNLANSQVKKIVETLKELGVDEKDIDAQSVSLTPSSRYQAGAQRVTGYRANSDINISFKNFTLMETVVEKTADLQIHSITGPYFDQSNYEELYQEALKQASLKVKEKIKYYEETYDLKFRSFISFTESRSNYDNYLSRKRRTSYNSRYSSSFHNEPDEIRATLSVSVEFLPADYEGK